MRDIDIGFLSVCLSVCLSVHLSSYSIESKRL